MRKVERPDKDWLYQKYIVENMTRRDLAKLLGVTERLLKKIICDEYKMGKSQKLACKNTVKTQVELYGDLFAAARRKFVEKYDGYW